MSRPGLGVFPCPRAHSREIRLHPMQAGGLCSCCSGKSENPLYTFPAMGRAWKKAAFFVKTSSAESATVDA
jgi:hypothetical protein